MHIFNLIYYFSQFDISFVIKIINVKNVIRYLKFVFVMYRKSYVIYYNRE